MRAKKSLGQHFLRSEKALRAMIEAGHVSGSDVIVEIGPGTGVLTEKLLAAGARVVAIEKDDILFELLRQKFKKEISNRKLELIHDDIVKCKLSELKVNKYKLIANIPYNITGAILKKFLETDYQPESIVLLVQKEVAERIVAQDKKESLLSLSVKAYGTPSYIETVKAGSFVPMPKVDSAIIKISDISDSFFDKHKINKNIFFNILRAAFQQKRKMLRHSLKHMVWHQKPDLGLAFLDTRFNKRPEELSLQDWSEIVGYN